MRCKSFNLLNYLILNKIDLKVFKEETDYFKVSDGQKEEEGREESNLFLEKTRLKPLNGIMKCVFSCFKKV